MSVYQVNMPRMFGSTGRFAGMPRMFGQGDDMRARFGGFGLSWCGENARALKEIGGCTTARDCVARACGSRFSGLGQIDFGDDASKADCNCAPLGSGAVAVVLAGIALWFFFGRK
jgi:hypothetical protein